jgi:hypothetical protein
MRLTDDIFAYLEGTKYTNALPVTFLFDDEDYRYATQIELLCELAKGQKVIHVGCVDHTIETVRHKLKRNKWLHGRLCQSAARCHGIDIQEEGIRYIREKLGYHDTSCLDIFSDAFGRIAESTTWDLLLIPEVLEHIEDPAGFLRGVTQIYGDAFPRIVITVPNGISHDNWKLARKGTEIINSDHRFWFTPYTLAKTVTSAGLNVEKLLMCRHGTINRRAIFRNRFYRNHPLLRNDILCIAALP